RQPATPAADTGFLDAIRADPDDDSVRLIYADWLDEHEQPRRAGAGRCKRRPSFGCRMRNAICTENPGGVRCQATNGREESMSAKQIGVYLNDHLARSVVALELLEHLEKAHAGSELEHFLAHLRTDIEEDRR